MLFQLSHVAAILKDFSSTQKCFKFLTRLLYYLDRNLLLSVGPLFCLVSDKLCIYDFIQRGCKSLSYIKKI